MSLALIASGSARKGFVDITVPGWAWPATVGVIVLLLLIDILVLNRDASRPIVAARRCRDRRLGARRCHLRRGGGGLVRRCRRRGVVLRLPDREQPVDRQRVRVGVDPGYFAGATEVPAPRAVLGRVRRAGAARRVHLRRRGPDHTLRVDAVPLRWVPALHRGQAAARQRRAPRSIPTKNRVPAARAPVRADHRRVRRPEAVHARRTASGWRRRCSPCCC